MGVFSVLILGLVILAVTGIPVDRPADLKQSTKDISKDVQTSDDSLDYEDDIILKMRFKELNADSTVQDEKISKEEADILIRQKRDDYRNCVGTAAGGGAGGGAAIGAASGAAIGSVVPGIGTAIGALIGLFAGAGGGGALGAGAGSVGCG